jgi:hypothetical protein
MKNARYFYNTNGRIFSISDTFDEVVEECIKSKDSNNYKYFELFKGYEMDLKSLIQYKEDFNKWAQEIHPAIDYKKYYNHDSAVKMVFQSKSKKQVDELDLENITYKEFLFYENCPNSGLMSFDDTFKDQEIDAYGYDFSSFYPNMLMKINLPTKQGKRKKLKSIDYDNLAFGIYRIKITTNDKRFKKLFMFSKADTYTHYSINFAYKYKDEFNINFELIQDGDYNALIYDADKLTHSKHVFGKWFSVLGELKKRFPKNKLVKHLMSSLWGSLTSFKRECFEDDEINDLDISELSDPDMTEYKILEEKNYTDKTKSKGYRTVYFCIKPENPYKDNLARLKPFLVSYCRAYVGDLIMSEEILDNVVRIHTDGIVLNKPHDFTHLNYYPKPEDKTTGKMKFKNVIFYDKLK